MLTQRLIYASLIFFLVGRANADIMRDGVNVLTPTEKHTNITLAGGFSAELGPWLKPDDYTMVIRSISNWNDRFQVDFSAKVPLRKLSEFVPSPGIFIDKNLVVDLEAGREKIIDAAMAKRIATICHAEVVYRKHLDHELAIRFETDKSDYKPGVPITVSVLVKNVGTSSVFLRPELLFENQRSNLLSIVPSTGLPAHQPVDVRDPNDGFSVQEEIAELKPGGVLKLKQEDFGRWYKFKEEGGYSFIGMYNLELFDSLKATHPAWVEWLGDEFSITID